MATSKLKMYILKKNKVKYHNKVRVAFNTIKDELVELIKSVEQPTYFIKYLANCLSTSDIMTFVRILESIIEDAKKVKNDPEAKAAIKLCKYTLFRLNYLSGFVIPWTNITVHCRHCNHDVKTNFLYTDKICPYCGQIIL